MKTIVLYYSRTRKTKVVAETLAKELSADIQEIKDFKERSGFLNYLSASLDAFRESKTKITPENLNLEEYGLIYLGSPTWAGKPSPSIITFIDQNDLKGKDIILFATMGNQGAHSVIKRMNEKIEARGARMVNSFSIKTSGKELIEIKDSTLKKIEEMDLKIYGA